MQKIIGNRRSIAKQRIVAVILSISVYLFIAVPILIDGDFRALFVWSLMYILLFFMAVGAYLAVDN